LGAARPDRAPAVVAHHLAAAAQLALRNAFEFCGPGGGLPIFEDAAEGCFFDEPDFKMSIAGRGFGE